MGKYCLRTIDGHALPAHIAGAQDSGVVIAGTLTVYDHGAWERETYLQFGDAVRLDNEGGFWYDGDYAFAFSPAGTQGAYLSIARPDTVQLAGFLYARARDCR